jgi:hypothetical protein
MVQIVQLNFIEDTSNVICENGLLQQHGSIFKRYTCKIQLWRLTYGNSNNTNGPGHKTWHYQIYSTNSYRYFTDLYRAALHSLTTIIRLHTSVGLELVALCSVWRCPTSCQPRQGFPVTFHCSPQDQHRIVLRPVTKKTEVTWSKIYIGLLAELVSSI